MGEGPEQQQEAPRDRTVSATSYSRMEVDIKPEEREESAHITTKTVKLLCCAEPKDLAILSESAAR